MKLLISLIVFCTLTVSTTTVSAVEISGSDASPVGIYTSGMLVTTSPYGHSERTVEVWLRPDGVYRIFSETTKGPGLESSEDIYGIGSGRQLVAIQSPRVTKKDITIILNDRHFAIDDGAPALSFTRQGKNATIEYLLNETKVMDVSFAFNNLSHLLENALQATATPQRDFTQSRSAGSNSSFGYNFYTNQLCSYHYSYRNNVTNFFTVNTQIRSGCSWVRVSMWNWGLGTPCGGGWLGVGPLSSYYSSFTTYADTINGYSYEYMCSHHAAWDSDWILHVPWVSMLAGVPG